MILATLQVAIAICVPPLTPDRVQLDADFQHN